MGEAAGFIKSNDIFVYKLIDKRDKFLFFIVQVLNLSSNTPTTVFYGSAFQSFFAHSKMLSQTLYPERMKFFQER